MPRVLVALSTTRCSLLQTRLAPPVSRLCPLQHLALRLAAILMVLLRRHHQTGAYCRISLSGYTLG